MILEDYENEICSTCGEHWCECECCDDEDDCNLDYCCWHPMYEGDRDYCACKEYAEHQEQENTPNP